ncbi:MAG: hypothetical protein A3K10_01205 [Bacteroidetes bacterium RIFCSPLOWO2_12_FULL_31_6]|nr:MAG: hypothetical protein A3K10_01205 [Bacteroidetes bacterium RIFCSPLOWO2_12_FULL_31_6]
MKRVKLLLFLTLLTNLVFAQKKPIDEFSTIDKKALLLPDSLTKSTVDIANYINNNFNTNQEKVRAIYIWIATNIQYDIENMYALNFYEKKEEKISKPLQTGKGICENFAALFTDICLKSGIKSFVVEGYTKQNGLADYTPHAWSASLVDSAWFLFDPTWGSGYASGGKFYKKINNYYFKTPPVSFIKSHMPFDYLWQFLNYPLSNQEFYDGKTQQNKITSYFDFMDSIQVYEKQSHIDQLISSVYRIEKNGIKNSLIYDRLQHLKLEIERDKQNKIVNLYNSASICYNDGINELNEFINYRNKQFLPKKTDPEIQNMIDVANNNLKESKTKLEQISDSEDNIKIMIKQLSKSIEDASNYLIEQQSWLNVYFSKSKYGRKSMFYERKVSLFGFPLN